MLSGKDCKETVCRAIPDKRLTKDSRILITYVVRNNLGVKVGDYVNIEGNINQRIIGKSGDLVLMMPISGNIKKFPQNYDFVYEYLEKYR